jgi:hypothetical protein
MMFLPHVADRWPIGPANAMTVAAVATIVGGHLDGDGCRPTAVRWEECWNAG